jgi:hypothetical protein
VSKPQVRYLVKLRGRIPYGGVHKAKAAAVADAKDCSDRATVVRARIEEVETVWPKKGRS